MIEKPARSNRFAVVFHLWLWLCLCAASLFPPCRRVGLSAADPQIGLTHHIIWATAGDLFGPEGTALSSSSVGFPASEKPFDGRRWRLTAVVVIVADEVRCGEMRRRRRAEPVSDNCGNSVIAEDFRLSFLSVVVCNRARVSADGSRGFKTFHPWPGLRGEEGSSVRDHHQLINLS